MNRYLLLLLFPLFTLRSVAQTACPPNIGFENGDFSNWELFSGFISDAGVYELTSTGTSPVPGRQTIVSKAANSLQTDPYGGFPMVCPNGSNYSIILGNTDVKPQFPEGVAERISYTFVVPVGQLDYTIVYNYAIVLQDPAPGGTIHTTPEKPLFSAEIYDVESGQYITCASFSYNAGSSLPGFSPSPFGGGKGIVYTKGWTQSSIDLKGYAGKTVRLEFTARDCTPGGHFGYAYLDVNEPCGSAITGNTYCTNEKGIKLYAPTGYSAYTWFNSTFTKILGTGNTLTINPVPPDNTKIALAITPYAGLGCPDTLFTTIHAITAEFNFSVPDSVAICSGEGGYDLTSNAVKAGNSTNLTYTYYTDPDGLNFLPSPNSVQSGIYYIKASNPFGCTSILPVKVIVNRPVVRITNPTSVTYPSGIDISGVFIKDPNLTYAYYYDSQAKNLIPNFENIHYTGTYYIKATSKYGCFTITAVNITIKPPPPPEIIGANTFTPNGDGVNDNFKVSIKGYGQFGSLKIFNRYGKEVFSATDIATPWDGTYQGKPLPFGTYYWVFAGVNTYDRSPVHGSGAISLIR